MITKQDVQHIANLARLGLTPKEVGKFQKELSAILDFFKELKRVDASKIEPCSQPFSPLNVLRCDEPKEQAVERANQLVKAAPVKIGRYVKVKPIL